MTDATEHRDDPAELRAVCEEHGGVPAYEPGADPGFLEGRILRAGLTESGTFVVLRIDTPDDVRTLYLSADDWTALAEMGLT